MRRLLNLCLLLVLLGSVGYLLYKAKLLPFGPTSTTANPTPSAAPAPIRDSLRISVAHRPEILLVSALKRLLEAENLKIEIVPFDAETSWMELAAGELDVVIAPIGEAVTAQARFQAGRFLFISGVSQGYDVILTRSAEVDAPKTLAVAGGQGGELFAIAKFPDSRLVTAASQQELQSWLTEGAVQAAVLESASLRGELAQSGKKLGATSPEGPMPTIVVLSQGLLEENASTTPRIDVLLRALDSWSGLIGYLSSQPELLRSTLKQEADEMGVDLEILLRDYQFLTPNVGRDALVESCDAGLLKQTLDLLVLARTGNLTAPSDWNTVLELPSYLAQALPGDGPVAPTAGPTAEPAASPSPALEATPQISPTGSETPAKSSGTTLPTHTYAGSPPPDPWPEPRKMPKARQPLEFPPALMGEVMAAATVRGLDAWDDNGKFAFQLKEGGAPLAPPLADENSFYVLQAGMLRAVDINGKTTWAFPFEGVPGAAILTPDNVVFTLEGAGYEILAISKKSGQISWQKTLANPAASPPVYADSGQPVVAVLDDQGNANVWNAQSGAPVLEKSIGEPSFLAPAAGGDQMAVLDPNGGVRLVSLADGSTKWEVALATALAGTPTLTDNLVLVPAKDTYLYALDRSDGTIKEKRRLSVPLSSAPVVVGDHVYCCDELGGVHSLSLPGLELNWSKSLGKTALRGPVFTRENWALLGSDGTLLLYKR